MLTEAHLRDANHNKQMNRTKLFSVDGCSLIVAFLAEAVAIMSHAHTHTH